MGSKMIHGRTAQKIVSQQPDRFWTFTSFDNFCLLQTNLVHKPVPLEAPLNYLSIHIKNIQNGLCMQPGCRFWCGLLLNFEMDSNLSFFGTLLAFLRAVTRKGVAKLVPENDARNAGLVCLNVYRNIRKRTDILL